MVARAESRGTLGHLGSSSKIALWGGGGRGNTNVTNKNRKAKKYWGKAFYVHKNGNVDSQENPVMDEWCAGGENSTESVHEH